MDGDKRVRLYLVVALLGDRGSQLRRPDGAGHPGRPLAVTLRTTEDRNTTAEKLDEFGDKNGGRP
jgi:hypothetical protein